MTDALPQGDVGGGTPLRGHHVLAPTKDAIKGAMTPVPVGSTFRPRRLETQLDRMTRRVGGRRSKTLTERKRGRYIRSRQADGEYDDIAFDATLRVAAVYQRFRPRGRTALVLRPWDIRRKVRIRRAANGILFVVDASWSMAAAERMAATKGAILSLLVDAYQRRDRVGLIVFQRQEARLVLELTNSVDRARRLLKEIPVGGKTPLSSGLWLAYRVLLREVRRRPDVRPLLILLTDGAANVSMGKMPPYDEALAVARQIRRAGIRSVVINMEYLSFDRGLAQGIADALGAPCYTLPELKAEALYRAVKKELGAV